MQMLLYTTFELRYYIDLRVAVLRLLAQHLHCDKQVPIPTPNLDWRTDTRTRGSNNGTGSNNGSNNGTGSSSNFSSYIEL